MQKSAIHKAASIMATIYGEDTSLWPYGMDPDCFNEGDIDLIYKTASDTSPVGFVGWQERREEGRPIGYYSVGVLPEYRRQGLAKKAVAAMLSKRASRVTEVRAMIVPGNVASLATANSLEGVVPIIKSAGKFDIVKGLKHVATGGAMALPTAIGKYVYSKDDSLDKHDYVDYATNTALGTAISTIFSVAGGKKGDKVGRKLAEALHKRKNVLLGSAITAIPLKSLIFKGLGTLDDAGEMVKDVGANTIMPATAPPVTNVESSFSNTDKVIAGLLGATAVGGAGYLANRALNQRKKEADRLAEIIEAKNMSSTSIGMGGGGKSGPMMRVTLPTRNPGDAETTIDVPMESLGLSKSLLSKITRDTKRRLRAETSRRTKRRTVDAKEVKHFEETTAGLAEL